MEFVQEIFPFLPTKQNFSRSYLAGKFQQIISGNYAQSCLRAGIVIGFSWGLNGRSPAPRSIFKTSLSSQESSWITVRLAVFICDHGQGKKNRLFKEAQVSDEWIGIVLCNQVHLSFFSHQTSALKEWAAGRLLNGESNLLNQFALDVKWSTLKRRHIHSSRLLWRLQMLTLSSELKARRFDVEYDFTFSDRHPSKMLNVIFCRKGTTIIELFPAGDCRGPLEDTSRESNLVGKCGGVSNHRFFLSHGLRPWLLPIRYQYGIQKMASSSFLVDIDRVLKILAIELAVQSAYSFWDLSTHYNEPKYWARPDSEPPPARGRAGLATCLRQI